DRADERRPHGTGADQADADAVAAEVEAEDLGDAAEAELAGAVGGVPGQAEEAGGGGDIDHVAAAAGLDHRRYEALEDADRADQVDVDHLLPVAVAEALDRAPGRDPGDVHYDVDAALGAVDLLGEGDDGLVVGDVGDGGGVDGPTRAFDLGDDLV